MSFRKQVSFNNGLDTGIGTVGNLFTTNITSTNIFVTNETATNLFATNFTALNFNVNSSTIGSIYSTNINTANLTAGTVLLTRLSAGSATATLGNLVSNNVNATTLTAGTVLLTTLSAGSANASLGNLVSNNVNTTTLTVGTVLLTTLSAGSANASLGTLVSNNVNATTLTAGTVLLTTLSAGSANASLGNIVSNNVNTTALTAGTVLLTTLSAGSANASLGNLVSNNVNATTLTAGTVLLTTLSAGSATATLGTLVSTNVSATNMAFTTLSAGSATATLGTLVSGNVNATTLTAGTVLLTTLSAGSANASLGNLVSNNVNTTTLTAGTVLLTTLSAGSANASLGNIVSNNVNTTALTAGTVLLTMLSAGSANASLGNLVSNNVNATTLTAGTVLLTTLSAGSANASLGNIVSNNVNTTALTAGTVLLTTLSAGSANASLGNIVSNNVNTTALTAGTVLLTTLSAGSATATLGTVVSNNVNATTLTAGTVLLTTLSAGSANASLGNIVSNNVNTTALTAGTILLTTLSAGSATATLGTLVSGNVNTTNLTAGTLVSTNISVSNLTATTALLTNVSIDNLTTGTLVSTNISATNLTVTNVLSTNQTITGGLTATASANTVGAIITTGGNVGIGITPSQKLHLYDANTGSTLILAGFASGESNNGIWFHLDDSLGLNRVKSKILAVGSGSFGRSNLHFCLNGANDGNSASLLDTRLIIQDSGNVGIGTSSPSQIFQVGDGARLRISNDATDYSLIGTKTIDDSNNTRIVISGQQRGVQPGNIEYIATTMGSHIFYNQGGNVTAMTIVSSGNVGIGTASPNSRLHVVGDTTNIGGIIAEFRNNNNSERIRILDEISGFPTMIESPTGNGLGFNSGTLKFFTSSTTERMRITNTGNVGIGTESPNFTLTVNGTIGANSITTGALAATNISVTNLVATNETVVNLTVTNETVQNLIIAEDLLVTDLSSSNATVTNALITNLSATNLAFTAVSAGSATATIGTVVSSNINVTSLTAGSELVTNLSATNLAFTAVSAGSATATIGTLVSNNINVTALTAGSELVTNLSATNLAFTAVSAGSATATIGTLVSNNINVTALTAASELVTNLSATNLAFTAVSAGSATATIGTVVSNNMNVTSLTAGSELVTNLSATNLAFTSVSAGSATATIGTVVSNNINVTSLTAGSELVTNLSATNLAFTAVSAGSATATIGTIVSSNVNVTSLTSGSELVTNLSATNLAFTAVSAGSATATVGTVVSSNINVTSLTAGSELVTNLSATNLAFTAVSAGSATATIGTVVSNNVNVTSLTAGSASVSNITATNILINKDNASLTITSKAENQISTLYLGTPHQNSLAYKSAIIAEGISNWSRSRLHFCLNNDTNNDASFSADIGDSRMTILPDGNVGIGITAPSFTLAVNGTIGAVAVTTGALAATNISVTNLVATNETVVNLTVTNETVQNLIIADDLLVTDLSSSNATVTNALITNLSATNLAFTAVSAGSATATIGTVVSNNINVTSLTAGSELVTNLSATNLAFSTVSAGSATATIGTLVSNNINVTSLTAGSELVTNLSATNLAFTAVSAGSATATIGSIMSTNINVTALTSSTALITNMSSTNITTTNILITHGTVTGDLLITGNSLKAISNSNTVGAIFTTGGNVGINNTAPNYRLDVNGDINFTGDLYENGSLFTTSQWTGSVGSALSYTSGTVIMTNTSISNLTVTNILATNETITGGLLITGGSLKATANDNTVGPIITTFTTTTFANLVPVTSGLLAYYNGSSWTGSQWSDLTTNGNNATVISGTINTTTENSVTYLYGGTSAYIQFPAGILPTTYTLFHIAKYNGANKGRIIRDDNSNPNWLSGFWSGKSEVVYHDGDAIGSNGNLGFGVSNSTNWVLSTDKRTSYRANGNFTATINNGANANVLSVNGSGEESDWAVSEIIVYNRELTTDEVERMESWLMDKYSAFTFTTAVTYPSAYTAGSVSVGTYGNIGLFVGISNTAPSYTLDVNGDINFTGDLYENGSLFTTSQWTGSVGSALSYTSGTVIITNSSVQNMTATNILATNLSTGTIRNNSEIAVGLELNNFIVPTPLAPLDVVAKPSKNNSVVAFQYPYGGGFRHWITSRFNTGSNNGNAIDFYLNTGNDNADSSTPGTNNQQIMTIAGLGVGIGNTSPGYTLDVTGTIGANSITTGQLAATNISVTNLVATNETVVNLVTTYETVTNLLIADDIRVTDLTSSNSNLTAITAGGITVTSGGLNATFNSNTIGPIVTTGGNVGIGNTAPSYDLDVTGDVNLTGTLYQNGVPFTGASQWTGNIGSTISYTSGNVNVVTATFTTAGNVGIGNTAPSYDLDVTGDINFTGDLYKNGTIIRLSPSYITRSAQTIGSQTISAGSNILLFPDAGQTTNDITYNTSGTFTVNKDGLYSVFVDVDTYNAVDVVDLYILKNNTEDSVNGRIAWVNNSGDDAVSINAMVYLAENDYITVNLTYSATSGSFTTPYAGSKVNSFAMSLLNVGSTTVRNSQWIGDIGSDVSYTSGNVLMNDVTVSNVLITNATVTGTILILGNSLKAVSNSNTIGNIITTGGNVGIGTVSPNSRLHVVGETTNAGGIIAEFRNNANSDRIRIIDENGATGLPPSIVSPTGNGLGFDAGTLRFFTPHLSTTASMIITSSRNVGIGTTSPSFTLDVNGTIGANAITTGALSATNISVSNLVATNETVVNLITTFETVTNLLIADDIRVTDLTSSNSNLTAVTAGGIVVTAGGLTATFNSNTLGNIITTGGNVGVGTTAPSQRLDVNGNVRIRAGFNFYDSFGISTANGFPNGNMATSGTILLDAYDNGFFGGTYRPITIHGNVLNFSSGLSNYNTRLHIDNSGNVGVGTTSPSSRLDVNGTLSATTYTGSSLSLSGSISFVNSITSHTFTNILDNNNTTWGNIVVQIYKVGRNAILSYPSIAKNLSNNLNLLYIDTNTSSSLSNDLCPTLTGSHFHSVSVDNAYRQTYVEYLGSGRFRFWYDLRVGSNPGGGTTMTFLNGYLNYLTP